MLKPGGLLILGCWNVRDTTDKPLTSEEEKLVSFLLEEWYSSVYTYIYIYSSMLCGLK